MAHKELYKELQKRMRQFRSEDETADFMAHDAAMCRRADTMAAQRAAREKLIAERRAADRRPHQRPGEAADHEVVPRCAGNGAAVRGAARHSR